MNTHTSKSYRGLRLRSLMNPWGSQPPQNDENPGSKSYRGLRIQNDENPGSKSYRGLRIISLATTYSPTGSPRQYHRRWRS